MSDLANSFGRAVDAYDAARPGYPPEAVDWLLAGGPRRVLDVGAGTGKFTAALVERGLEVVAVEPDEAMLARLAANLPGVDTRTGSAERIPLPDASVDAVFAAQAWHWVDAAAAVPEVVRVLRPGGELGLIWNVRDESVPWVAALAEVISESVAEATFAEVAKAPRPFGPMEERVFRWENPLDRDGVLALVTSRSGYITASADEQAAVLAGLNHLLDTHPDLQGVTEYRMPYLTHAFRARLQPAKRYEHALHGIKPGWWRGLATILAYLVLFFGISTVLGGVALAIDLTTGAITPEQFASGIVPITPLVLLATNLSIAATIPVAWLLQWALFGVRPRWLSSVTGGIRWRWLLRVASVIVPLWALYVSFAFLAGGSFNLDATAWLMLLIILTTTPFQAAGEEIGMRGLVQRSAGSWFAAPRVAFVVSTVVASVIFGLAHFAADPWLIAYYVLFGVAMSLAAHFTGGLEAPIVIHATNNVLLFVLSTVLGQLNQGIDRSAGAGGPFMLIPMAVVFAAAGISIWLGRRAGVVTAAPSPPSHYDVAPVR